MSDLLVHIKITHQKCSILRYKFEKNCEHCGKDVTEKGNCKKAHSYITCMMCHERSKIILN